MHSTRGNSCLLSWTRVGGEPPLSCFGILPLFTHARAHTHARVHTHARTHVRGVGIAWPVCPSTCTHSSCSISFLIDNVASEAAEGNGTADNLNDSSECCICLDAIVSPVVTPCLHVGCKACFTDVITRLVEHHRPLVRTPSHLTYRHTLHCTTHTHTPSRTVSPTTLHAQVRRVSRVSPCNRHHRHRLPGPAVAISKAQQQPQQQHCVWCWCGGTRGTR